MLRYPWQAPLPEETEIPRPWKDVPSKDMTDWVKRMLRCTFGKDTFAKTLLMNGFSEEVLDVFRRHNHERETQRRLASIHGASLSERQYSLQFHVPRLWKEARRARRREWYSIQRSLQDCRWQLEDVSHQSGAGYAQQAVQEHFKKKNHVKKKLQT